MKYLAIYFALTFSCGTANEIKTLFIADHLVDCTGVAQQKCMLIKEHPEDEWSNFYDQIAGFEYEEGYNYEVRVEVQKVDNPPADGSSLKYILKEVVSKVKSNAKLQSADDLAGTWKVIQITGLESIKFFPTFEFDPEENRVAGYAGCNNYFASYEQKGPELKLGHAGATRKMCQDMTVEDAFLKKLDQIAYYKKIKSELHLFDSKDNLIFLAILE